ncbi:hypothetical protein BDR04DRAFT_301187 [Suillus decipiens]|nr:hypothetical protein BDR04DRAFT_301187 [Suillus decipiens]
MHAYDLHALLLLACCQNEVVGVNMMSRINTKLNSIIMFIYFHSLISLSINLRQVISMFTHFAHS